MPIHLPQQNLLPSISALTLEDIDNDNDKPNQSMEDLVDGKIKRDETTSVQTEGIFEDNGVNGVEGTDGPVCVLADHKSKQEDADELAKTIQQILDDDSSLPKDVGEINIKGHLRFDEEMPPDEETKKNTIHNAMLYQLGQDDENSSDFTAKKSTKHKDHMFDTYSKDADIRQYQMSIVYEHNGYSYHNNTRSFFIPFNDDKPSTDAVKWTLSEMVDDNDMVIVLKVVSLASVMKNGVQSHRKECRHMYEKICSYNTSDKKIKLFVEIRIGAPEYYIAKCLREFDPTILVMGTKGIKKSKLSSFLSEDTSITKHFLDNAKIPVIVVNPLYNEEVATSPALKPTISVDAVCNTEQQLLSKIKSYPSAYDPLTASKTLELERAMNGESGSGSGNSRTSRFLRIGSSISRSPSMSLSSLSPIRSNDRDSLNSRTLSPRRTLSPFRLFGRH